MNNALLSPAVYQAMFRPALIAVAVLAFVPVASQAQQADTLRLSLSDAVAIALRNSDEVRLSAAQVGVARSTALPQLRINTSYQHAWESARANAVGAVFNQPNTYNTSLSLS